jgi:hypothetical protein
VRRGDGSVDVPLARLCRTRQRLPRRRVEDVEQVAALPLDPAPAHEQLELAAMRSDPLERRRRALGGGAVFHTLEDVGDCAHEMFGCCARRDEREVMSKE